MEEPVREVVDSAGRRWTVRQFRARNVQAVFARPGSGKVEMGEVKRGPGGLLLSPEGGDTTPHPLPHDGFDLASASEEELRAVVDHASTPPFWRTN